MIDPSLAQGGYIIIDPSSGAGAYKQLTLVTAHELLLTK